MQHVSISSSSVSAELKTLRENGRDKSKKKSQVLSLYTTPPSIEITLDEFEMLSLERLQLLRSLESLKNKGYDENDFKRYFGDLLTKHQLNKKDGFMTSNLSESVRDHISHFILRLAYCRTEELRRWFLQYECLLLKCRLDNLSDEERYDFMAENGLEFEQVSNDEKSSLSENLIGLAGVMNHAAFIKNTYFKVPFQQALSLISKRMVYLQAGCAYVPLQKLVSIIVTRFRIFLSRSLVEAANMFEMVGSDSRIGPLLKNMNKQFIGNDFSKSQAIDKLSPEKVDLAAEINMPLCMKNLHTNLRKEHKLKHWGRLQYGLFLKGAGLDMEGALQFWENHFTKLMNHDQFVKSYSYSFRHMYGKEGARKNYTPYSCMKIIMGTPPEAGAYHGCPYRHSNDAQLSGMLAAMKINSNDAKDILNLAKTSNYQVACQKHFDVTHPGHGSMDLKLNDSVANHPNQWFLASVNYHKLKSGVSISSQDTSDVNVASNSSISIPNPIESHDFSSSVLMPVEPVEENMNT
eukprot:gene13149-17617_t